MKTTEDNILPRGRSDAFFRRRNIPPSLFSAALLLFFLPFAELRCGSYTLAGNTGIGLATGKDWEPTLGQKKNQFLKDFSPEKQGDQLPVAGSINIFLLVAMAAAVAGIFFSVMNFQIRPAVIFCAGLLAVLMLIAAMVQLRLMLRDELEGKGAMEGWDQNVAALIKIRFTIWYFASLLLFAAAAFIGYKQHLIMLQDAIDKTVRFEFDQEERLDSQ